MDPELSAARRVLQRLSAQAFVDSLTAEERRALVDALDKAAGAVRVELPPGYLVIARNMTPERAAVRVLGARVSQPAADFMAFSQVDDPTPPCACGSTRVHSIRNVHERQLSVVTCADCRMAREVVDQAAVLRRNVQR